MLKSESIEPKNSTENKQAGPQISAETYKKIINQGATMKGARIIEAGDDATPNYRAAAFHTAPDHVIKKPLLTYTGKKHPDGTRCEIGKIYVPREWIGKTVMLSTTWNEGETIPKPRKTHPQEIRNPWNPAEIITVINRTVGKHQARGALIGCVFVPREWIGRDVLIRPAEAEATAGTESTPASIPAESTAPQGAE